MAYFTNNYGHMHGAGLTIPIVGVGLWAEFPSGFVAGLLNGFMFSGGNSLVCNGAGIFYFTASASIECPTTGNQDIALSYMINGVVAGVVSKSALFASGNPTNLTITDIIALQLGDVVKLVAMNQTGIHNLLVDATSLSIARLQR